MFSSQPDFQLSTHATNSSVHSLLYRTELSLSLESAWGPRYRAPGRTQQKTPSLSNTSIAGRCRGNLFTERLPCNACSCYSPFQTILLFLACMLWPLPSSGCFCGSTVLAFTKYATMSSSLGARARACVCVCEKSRFLCFSFLKSTLLRLFSVNI
jgi:hypothetical protein